MKQKAFVTGGTGFIGINLIKLLVEQEWKVTALHRPSSDISELKKLPVDLAVGSITDFNSLKIAIPQDTEVVFHLAGDTNMWSQRNARQTQINVQGTENMIRASVLKNVDTFIHTSSIAAWGVVISGVINEETPQKGNESSVNYAKSKWAGEQKALQGLDHGLKVVILNPANVIGPHDTNNWGRLFFALRDGDLPGITNGSMSITHVREVVKAHLSAVENGRAGERYILGGRNYSFADLIKMMADVSGISNIPKTVPTPILKLVAYLSAARAYFTNKEPDITPELAMLMTRKNVSYSSKKAREELDYHIPPLKESVQDCYRWLKKENLL